MANGDTSNFVSRLTALLPSWFPDTQDAPVLYGLLTGIGSALSQVFSLQAYVRLQTRLQTATDGWLDLASFDYFGDGLPRKTSEQDAPFRNRIMATLFPEKGTRNGMVRALSTLTGNAPTIFEPARPQDSFCLGHGGLGAGQLGSYSLNNQAFVTVYRPINQGGALVAGLGSSYAGLASPYLAMEDAANLYGAAEDSDVYDTIESVKPIGCTVWTRIATAA